MAETKRGKVAVVSSSKFGKNSSEVIKTKDGGEKDTDGTLEQLEDAKEFLKQIG